MNNQFELLMKNYNLKEILLLILSIRDIIQNMINLFLIIDYFINKI